MTFLNQLNTQEKKVSIYLLIGALFFLLFDYSIASFFHSLNYQTKSLFGTLTHFGDSLYFFIPTILTWALVKIIKSKNQIINTISEISLFIFLNILLSGIVTQILKHAINTLLFEVPGTKLPKAPRNPLGGCGGQSPPLKMSNVSQSQCQRQF